MATAVDSDDDGIVCLDESFVDRKQSPLSSRLELPVSFQFSSFLAIFCLFSYLLLVGECILFQL